MVHVLSRVLKAVSRAASRELGRYMIDGINFRSDGTVEATDGRWTLRGRATVDAEKPDFKARIMAQEAVAAILRDPLVKRTKSASVQSNGTFTYWGSAGESPLEWRDAEFPATDNVIPVKQNESQGAFVVAISAEILAALAAAAKDVQPDNPCVRFQFQNGADGKPSASIAIRVDMGGDESAVSGAVMPMSL